MNILALDTSTERLSLAVATATDLFEFDSLAGHRHAEIILGEIDALLGRAGIALTDVGGIAFGAGPGSFTGLRIACGVAQGLAFARGVPVLGVVTLEALAEASGAERVVACLDARMAEVYHAAYQREQAGWTQVIAPGLHRPDAVPLPDGSGWTGCGSGFAAHEDALRARHGGRIADVRAALRPTAGAIARLARPRFLAGQGTDAAAAAPFYLRDKVALKTSER